MRSLRGALLAILLLGLVVFVLGVARGDAARAWGSYLVNFLFWSGLAQAGVAFLALLHVTRARWGEPLRASAESMTSFLPVSFGLALFLPLGHGSFYRWLPSASAKEQAWLSAPFVSARLLLAMALLNGLGLLFVRRAGRGQLAPAVLVVYACVLTLLSFDWVMSLDPRWFSTLIGGHFFIGTLYAGLAAVALLALLARERLPPAVMHDHGKLLLGFCMLWIYLVYTQYLVIWYGDLPEETGFLLRRTAASPWAGLSAFVVATGFLIPFLLLLSRSLKLSRAGLASVAALALVGIFAERVLLVMPSLTEKGPFGLVELLVSAGFFAAFLLCILPTVGTDRGGVMSKQTAGLAALLAAALAAPAAPADGQAGTWEAPPEAKSLKRPAPADEKSVERGKKLFKQNCVPCHGETGMGDGPMGKAMGIKPGNLTSAARMSAHTDGEIFWKVSKGKDPMPIFEKKLSEKDRWDVVAYVRTLAK